MLKILLAAGSAGWKCGLRFQVGLLLLAGFGLTTFQSLGQSVLAQFPLTSSYASTVAAGITTPSTPTFSTGSPSTNLNTVVLTTSGVVSGYSTVGQATAPVADGTNWTTTVLSARYQEFATSAAAGYNARIDSLILSTAVLNSANGKLAIAYSTDAFATSTYITGWPSAGTAILNAGSSGTAAFTKVAVPLNSIITLVPGGRLAFRLYYGVGSISARPALLRALSVRGQTITTGATTTTTAQVSFNTPTPTSAGSYAYALSTSPAGGTATLTTAPTSGNNYVATYTISGLTAGSTYTATAVGTNPAATITTTITSPSFTTSAGTCADPATLTISSIAQTAAAVSFTAATGSTGYTLKYYPTATGTPIMTHTLGTSPTSDNLTGLTGGTDYTVTLQSTCALGTSTLLSTSFTTLTCADPTGLAVANATRTSNSASISFVPGAANTSYVVTYYPTGSPGSAVTVSPAPTASPVALTGLSANTNYTVTLQSTCANGATGNTLTTTFTTRLTSSPVLQQWPLTADANDDATVRMAGVLASTATLSASTTTPLVLSDGTSNDSESGGLLPAYSAKGQGLAPTGGGTGWSGTGAAALATRYEEFAVTAAAGGTVRVDSLVFSAGGYGSPALLAVAYSTDGFAGSTFILGSLAAPATVNKASAAAGYSVLRLPLTGPAGVTLSAGSLVAFRFYYAINSGSARHALTKNVYVTGVPTSTCPSPTAVGISNATATKVQLDFTPGSSNTAYTVTLTPQGGSTTTISPAPTASPVVLTGLSPTSTYTATLQSTCGGTPGYVQSITFTTPAASSSPLQQWLLTADNTDNAAVRSYAVLPTTPTLTGLTLSATAPYSNLYGQALSPNTNGDGGGWSSSASATINENFDVTASAGNNFRADSLVFATNMLNTGNGLLAVAYSTDGFATSTFILGTLATPVALLNSNGGVLTTRRLALNGGTGVTRTSGQTLSFRFYFAANSSGVGRYASLRNVYLAGEGFVNGLPNLIISDAQTLLAGTTYGNVTVASGGVATLGTTLVAQGTTTVQSGGVLNTACQPITGTAFTLAAGGELQICAPAGITASGSTGAVQVTGTRSFSPDGIYTYTGTFTTGTNQQSGSGLPATVRSLKINLATATDSLQLNSDVTTTTSLVLSRGVLKGYLPDGSAAHLLTLGRNATISETATSFVLGQVQSATLSFVADGNSTGFGGLGITLTAHTTGGAALPGSTYVLRTTGTPVYGATPTTGANAGITSRSIRRQYRVVPTTDTGLNMDMVFAYSPSTAELNGISAANLQLFSRPIAGGLWRPEGGTNSANTLTLTNLDHLSDWTLGNLAAPLPVTLTSFEAERQGQQAVLTWATATEHNSKGFAVQVSTDGREFRTAGFVPSATPNSTQAQTYRFIDAPANATGTRYYRLQQVDLGGSSTYTAVRSLTFANAVALVASPNPFTDVLYLNTNATEAARTSCIFTDAAGRPVLKQMLEVPAGAAQLTLGGLGQLPKGFYVLRFTLDSRPHYLKVVKE